MKILVTGANGQLGSELRECSTREENHTFLFTDYQELDITSLQAVLKEVETFRPDAIINAAAYTAVDQAEQEEEKARAINITGPANLAEAANTYQALLIHISTDYVFNGQQFRPYQETDPTYPTGVYGQTKREGEQEIMNRNTNALIIRTSWLYSSYGHNFVKTMLRLGKTRDSLQVVSDQVGTPTYAADLAAAVLQIVPQAWPEKTEIYHYSNEGVASWYDFAKAIFREKAIACTIHPIDTKDFPTPAERPFYSLMHKGKIKRDFQLTIPHWQESLKKCLTLL